MMEPPEIPTAAFDPAFKVKLQNDLPTMNEPEIINQWFSFLPDPARDKATQEVDDRLYVCGMLLTELRRRAIGQRSVERLHRVHVFSDEMAQVTQHIKFRHHQAKPEASAASKGIIIPGYNA